MRSGCCDDLHPLVLEVRSCHILAHQIVFLPSKAYLHVQVLLGVTLVDDLFESSLEDFSFTFAQMLLAVNELLQVLRCLPRSDCNGESIV